MVAILYVALDCAACKYAFDDGSLFGLTVFLILTFGVPVVLAGRWWIRQFDRSTV
jgi:hypothetical protein